jgi:hypothetical protein
MSLATSPAVRRSAALLIAAGGMTAVVAAPASAAPNNQSGLVNVALVNTTVQVPISVAANVCNVAVNALASQVPGAAAPCDAAGDSVATAPTQPSSGPNRQNGLVNLYVANTTVQIPIGIAANVCNVAVNVLATQTPAAAAACTVTNGVVAQPAG